MEDQISLLINLEIKQDEIFLLINPNSNYDFHDT